MTWGRAMPCHLSRDSWSALKPRPSGRGFPRAQRRPKATPPNPNRSGRRGLSAKTGRLARKAKVPAQVTAVPTIAPAAAPGADRVEIAARTAAVTVETAVIAAKADAPAADVPSTAPPTSNWRS